MLDLIIFDKDGTLLEISHLWDQPSIEAVDHLLTHTDWTDDQKIKYKETLGIVDGRLEMNALFSSGSIRDQAETLAKVVPLTVAEIAEYLEASYLDFVNHCDDSAIQVIDGAEEVLEALVKEYHLALVTNDNASLTEATMRRAGLWHYFDYAASSDDHAQKPDPETLDILADRYQTTRERMVMVGDSALDMEYGRQTHCAIGYAHEPSYVDHLTQADVMIDHLQELLPLIERLNKGEQL